MNKGSFLELKNVTKSYDGNVVIENVSINIKEGHFLTFLGPSGSGKTTLLRMIAGFENPDSGDILLNNKSILNLLPNKRAMSTVFQNYALFPHFNVFDNISYSLKVKKRRMKKFPFLKKAVFSKNEIRERVTNIIQVTGLHGKERMNVTKLSGGEQQRVAIARSLIAKPKILLLDEPLGALDLTLRREMQFELKNLHNNFGITFIYVTHDQEEALFLSDYIVVIKKGRVIQKGLPIDIYNEPKNKWVAQFIGSSNIIKTAIYRKRGFVEWDNILFPCVDYHFNYGEEVDVVLRPEDIDLVDPDKGYLNGVVKTIRFKGIHWEIKVQSKKYLYLIHSTDKVEVNKKVGLKWEADDVHVMKKT